MAKAKIINLKDWRKAKDKKREKDSRAAALKRILEHAEKLDW